MPAMVRPNQQHVLLIADQQRQVESALLAAVPAARLTSVVTYFDGIAELISGRYSTVLASLEPILHRPEAAVHTLRQADAEARLVLFGSPATETTARRMLQLGCDDYLITPPSTAELQQVLGSPLLRIAPAEPAEDDLPAMPSVVAPSVTLLHSLPLAEMLLDVLIDHPQSPVAAVIERINQRLAGEMRLSAMAAGAAAPQPAEGMTLVCHPLRDQGEDLGTLVLDLPSEQDPTAARHLLARLAAFVSRVHALGQRQARLQRLAITDELTGAYNSRYFRHFLSRILEKAAVMRFPVSVLLFDIDNFKKYNDQYGHAVGDEILRQTAALMKRCTREHDLVARIGGDEFAVVFWEKEGPRQPKNPSVQATPGKPPQDVTAILERFRRLMATQQFPGLGPAGKGTLTISGGLAVYPWNGRTMEELVDAADRALVFGAKQQDGKNSIFLVGSGGNPPTSQP